MTHSITTILLLNVIYPLEHAACRLCTGSTALARDELVVLDDSERCVLSEALQDVAAILLLGRCLSYGKVLAALASSGRATAALNLLLLMLHLDIGLVNHHLWRASLL